jgi:hypothetical protein
MKWSKAHVDLASQMMRRLTGPAVRVELVEFTPRNTRISKLICASSLMYHCNSSIHHGTEWMAGRHMRLSEMFMIFLCAHRSTDMPFTV